MKVFASGVQSRRREQAPFTFVEAPNASEGCRAFQISRSSPLKHVWSVARSCCPTLRSAGKHQRHNPQDCGSQGFQPSTLCSAISMQSKDLRLSSCLPAYSLDIGSPIPSRRSGALEVKEASEPRWISRSPDIVLCFCCSSDADLSPTCSSCNVPSSFGTLAKFCSLFSRRGPLLKLHRYGNSSLGMPPPWSDILMMTCWEVSQINTSIGGDFASFDFRCSMTA